MSGAGLQHVLAGSIGLLPASSALAEEVATIVIDGQKAAFNRELPAGTPIKLLVQTGNGDPLRGTLTIWPAEVAQCGPSDPQGGKQYQKLALAVTGSDGSKSLEGTIAPLQIGTQYCFQVSHEHAMSADKVNTVSLAVAARSIPWQYACSQRDGLQRVRDDVASAIAAAIATASPAGATSSSARIAEAASAIVQRADVESRCRRLVQASEALALLTPEAEGASHQQEAAAQHLAGLPPNVDAWPVVVTKNNDALSAHRLTDLIATQPALIATVIADVERVDQQLASELRVLASAKDADASALRQQLREKLRRRPLHPLPIALYLPSKGRSVLASEIAASPAGFIADLHQNRALIMQQVERLGVEDSETSGLWMSGLERLANAADELVAVNQRLEDAHAARNEMLNAMHGEVKQAVSTDMVRDLLRQTEVARETTTVGKPADEKASWIAPILGIMVAAPLIRGGSNEDGGFDDPWLTPFVGASIYFVRVDRVIDLNQLVGDTFWQRNSLAVGLLLSNPNVNGKAVSGPWDAAAVPFMSIGTRLSQYIRTDIGVIPFEYVSRNPVVTDRRFGAAFSLGLSLDADVWAVVSGKIGK